ncbi:uncharacterized protein BX664DRAFT_334119 [Halteromyces radiatus]|uniref:uncharacterized protein n=1 Tax=Halteromyces radiatus TaxID=101107 RepID=UPI00221EF901|nr:uncharacterized protein BX664DRAFT_334119 [Halteromyces radiatus]KAI8089869.1 hypothetical protein BX664DRAFT_334119 [Halteromyces radiatus]
MTAVMKDAAKEIKRTKRIELLIIPGKTLGPFRLGSSLWDIIQFLRERPLFFPSVELKYGQLDPLRSSFIVCLPYNGINLWFDGSLQRLTAIECSDPSKVKLVYQNSDVSSSRTIPTFLLIYKCFGPTYLGEFKADQNIYILNYPGLSFTFPIPQKYNHLYTNSTELPLEFPDGTTPIASKMYLFHSQNSNWETASPPPISKTLAEINGGKSTKYGKLGRRELEVVVAKPSHGVKLYFPSLTSQHQRQPTPSPSTSSTPNIVPTTTTSSPSSSSSKQGKDNNDNMNETSALSSYQEVEILLRVTALQDILADLGKPSRVFYKEEDKMKIHSVADDGVAMGKMGKLDSMIGLTNSEGDDDRDLSSMNNATDYFLNYFHLGMDILVDGTEHVCKKIILHGNIPGHYDFQRYKRCPFKLVFPKELVNGQQNPNKLLVDVESDPDEDQVPAHIVTANMKITTIQQRIPWKSSNKITSKPTDETQLEQQKPVILTRGPNEQNPFGSTYLTGYSEGIVMEVMKNGYVPTVVLF